MASNMELTNANGKKLTISNVDTETADVTVSGTELKDAVDNRLGVGQTWQAAELTDTGATFTDGTPSYRAVGIPYTNDTGKPIQISTYQSQNVTGSFTVDGVTSIGLTITPTGVGTSVNIIIPAGSTYTRVGDIGVWHELR